MLIPVREHAVSFCVLTMKMGWPLLYETDAILVLRSVQLNIRFLSLK